MKALIDGDIVTYRCAAATEHDNAGLACWQAGEMMNRILQETNAEEYTCFLSGGDNFRYSIYPEYKANRRDMQKPQWYGAIREYLVTHWNATVSDGHEADDAMGVAQCAAEEAYWTAVESHQVPAHRTVICSLDKDMLMIPGKHYNFVKGIHSEVDELSGLRHFYWQAIMGDRVDNIPGHDGKMRNKVPKFMQWMIDELYSLTEEKDMYDFLSMHHCADIDLGTCLKCLWIWRKENDIWQPLQERTGPMQG